MVKKNAVIIEFFTTGSFKGHYEVVDSEISFLLLLYINHNPAVMHHNQPVTVAKSQLGRSYTIGDLGKCQELA